MQLPVNPSRIKAVLATTKRDGDARSQRLVRLLTVCGKLPGE